VAAARPVQRDSDKEEREVGAGQESRAALHPALQRPCTPQTFTQQPPTVEKEAVDKDIIIAALRM